MATIKRSYSFQASHRQPRSEVVEMLPLPLQVAAALALAHASSMHLLEASERILAADAAPVRPPWPEGPSDAPGAPVDPDYAGRSGSDTPAYRPYMSQYAADGWYAGSVAAGIVFGAALSGGALLFDANSHGTPPPGVTVGALLLGAAAGGVMGHFLGEAAVRGSRAARVTTGVLIALAVAGAIAEIVTVYVATTFQNNANACRAAGGTFCL